MLQRALHTTCSSMSDLLKSWPLKVNNPLYQDVQVNTDRMMQPSHLLKPNNQSPEQPTVDMPEQDCEFWVSIIIRRAIHTIWGHITFLHLSPTNFILVPNPWVAKV